jgi:hypothetical protein
MIKKVKEVTSKSTPKGRVKTRLATRQRNRERTRAEWVRQHYSTETREEAFRMQVQDKHQGKDQGMTRVKVITDKHTTKNVF